ncbi:dihydrofolate reductase family protein, partial [Sphaerisporangium fuscum]|uniref:dihydrofolate reductase family protein n=1 Tax=Sphaerisporangium fuscum TaxID=2835868 RepID=UPI0027E25B79
MIGGDDTIEQLAALRAGTDGSISVGGAALATQLLRAGLLDELPLFTHPAILGFGRPLSDDYDVPIELDLLEQRSFKQGVTTPAVPTRFRRIPVAPADLSEFTRTEGSSGRTERSSRIMDGFSPWVRLN